MLEKLRKTPHGDVMGRKGGALLWRLHRIICSAIHWVSSRMGREGGGQGRTRGEGGHVLAIHHTHVIAEHGLRGREHIWLEICGGRLSVDHEGGDHHIRSKSRRRSRLQMSRRKT